MTVAQRKSDSARAWRRASIAAWAALAAHLLAGLALLVVLRDGLDTNPDAASRLAYIAEHRAAWIGGWLTWHAASLSIVVFIVLIAAAARMGGQAALARVAVAFVIGAVAMDLAGQTLLIGFMPPAADPLIDPAFILRVHRIAVLLSGYAGNGLYTLASLLTAAQLWRESNGLMRLAGLTIGVSGAALSVAALVGSAQGMYWSNAVLLPAILLWLGCVALLARRLARSAAA
ncbi:MAG: hypothetical protein KJZ69_16640 [Phycisphaerales bacterium]|nr:hypothetical protein [Phycisphaerales bacterium]